MRVVYYSRPCYLDHAFLHVKALSNHCELHFLIEGSHNKWWHNIIESGYVPSRGGVVNARTTIENFVPSHIWSGYLGKLSTFNLIGYTKDKILDPLTWIENWRVSGKVVGFLKSISPDVIHFDDISLRSLLILSKLKNAVPSLPIVLTIHDPVYHTGEWSIKSEIARRIGFNYVDRYVLCSRFYHDEFLRRYNIAEQKVHIIPLGYMDIFRDWSKTPAENEEDNTVLFFGRISPYKGLATLLKAAPLVAEAVSDVKFIIAGKPVKQHIIPDIPKLNDNATIEVVMRYIPNDELKGLIQRATVIVAPYVDATQSGVILTAYAFNKPVVATNVGGIPEIVKPGKTGLLVPANDYRSLASALIKILKDSKMRVRMKNEIQAQGENELSWERIALQMLQVYGSL